MVDQIKDPLKNNVTGPIKDETLLDTKANDSSVEQAGKGIISSATDYKAPEIKPITTEVGADETVESRLNKLTAGGSEYTTLASKDAQRNANSRGLINSTMAGAAGTEAAIRSALPIAQQDAKTYTDARLTNQGAQNEFLRNRQSADLNKETASHNVKLNQAMEQFQSTLRMDEEEFSVGLRNQAEQILNDAKFKDEIKLQYVNSINQISRDAQQQITDIGMSDRSAEQQATAIQMVKENRDSQLAVYQDLLAGFNDWEWGTDFTQGVQAGETGGSQAALAAATPPPAPLSPKPPVGVPPNAVSDGNGNWSVPSEPMASEPDNRAWDSSGKRIR